MGASLRWTGCSRCGVMSCGGSCGHLGVFSSVQSLFHYSGFHRELLLRAKDIQEPTAIDAFARIYGDVVHSALVRLIRSEHISLVVLPRLSLRRVISLNWHPSDFWTSQLQFFANTACGDSLFSYSMRLPHVGRRRAHLGSATRRRKAVLKSEALNNSGFEKFDFNSTAESSRHTNILFVDDVLTSGGTMLDELDFVRSELLENPSPMDSLRRKTPNDSLPAKFNAHILTLFRTPVSGGV